MAGDGSSVVVSVALPAHMVAVVCEALLDTAATVVTTPSLADAQACMRDLVSGRYSLPLGDAIAAAIVGALVVSPDLREERKNAFLGLDSVSALTDRIQTA